MRSHLWKCKEILVDVEWRLSGNSQPQKGWQRPDVSHCEKLTGDVQNSDGIDAVNDGGVVGDVQLVISAEVNNHRQRKTSGRGVRTFTKNADTNNELKYESFTRPLVVWSILKI
jgi:hypothetical protein